MAIDERLETALDTLLLAFVVIALPVLSLRALAASPISSTFFFVDPSWFGPLWEVLEAIGVTGAVARVSVWIWQKFRGLEKYFAAIVRALDEAPGPLAKSAVRDRVRELLDDEAADRFEKRFEQTWLKMRREKLIKKIGSSDWSEEASGGDAKEPLFTLSQDD